MLIEFGHRHGQFAHHGEGARRAFESGVMAKVIIVLLAFVLAVVARYAATQWAERTYGDPPRANLIGWLAFFAVLIVAGLGGLKIV